MRFALFAVIGVAACGDDPSLRVDVEHPIAVTTTTISVYESDSIRCANIEFGDLSEEQLLSALVAEARLAPEGTTGALDGLSRTEVKMIVARGHDADGVLATAGCEEKGLIGDHDQLTIRTTRASIASIGPLVIRSSDGGDPFTVAVALTDAGGVPLPGNRVSWRVHAPDGAAAATTPSELVELPSPASGWQLAEPTCTNDNGVRQLHPVPPTTVGGFAVQVRPSWPIELPPLVTGFAGIDLSLTDMIRAPNVRRPCAIRRTTGAAGRASLVCLELASTGSPDVVAREYAIATPPGGVTVGSATTTPFAADDAVAVYALDEGAERRVYAVTIDGAVEGVLHAHSRPGVMGVRALDDAQLIPACGGAAARLAVRTSSPLTLSVEAMDPLGGSPPAVFQGATTDATQLLELRSTGCLTESDATGAKTKQALVVDLSRRETDQRVFRTLAYFDCDRPQIGCVVELPLARAGGGFTSHAQPRLAGANIDASGVIVSEWTVLPITSGTDRGYRRVELARYPAAAVPRRLVFGHFDGDGKPDTFWDLATVDPGVSSFQVSYAQAAGTARLSALATNQPLVVVDALVGDVTNDGFDDVVLIGTSFDEDANPQTRFGFVVIPTRVAAMLPALTTGDPTCP